MPRKIRALLLPKTKVWMRDRREVMPNWRVRAAGRKDVNAKEMAGKM